jgi:pimeloyl-ACP methyl ester carboxylesterase
MVAPMIEREIPCLSAHGFFRMAYVEWPGPARRPVICAHGLTRNGRDFDVLAASLSRSAPVICPDMPGRGRSQWLDHAEDYSYPTYVAACAALIARTGAGEVDWVGTSMGGIIGMFLAAMPGTPIRRLVLNDIGGLIPAEGLRRLAAYVGLDPSFASEAELEADLRRAFAPFGRLADADWRHLARISTRKKADGTLGYAYDPRIGDPLRAAEPQDVDLWATYDAIKAPTLVLHGAESDILRGADARAMTERGPRARLIEFAGVGHAPALMTEAQIAPIRDFLQL